MLKFETLIPKRKCDPAGIQHGCGGFVPGTVFMIAYQGEAPAGKLDPDLVTSAGVQPDAYYGCFSTLKPGKLQPRVFHTGALPLDNKDLILAAVFKQKILPITAFRYSSVYLRYIFFDEKPLLY